MECSANATSVIRKKRVLVVVVVIVVVIIIVVIIIIIVVIVVFTAFWINSSVNNKMAMSLIFMRLKTADRSKKANGTS